MEINNRTWLSRVSANAVKCSATLHIKDLGAEIPLRWRTYMAEPKDCIITEVPREGETSDTSYHRLMPYNYAVTKLAHVYGAPDSSIHVGEKYNLYLLFTFDGSNYAFIITPLEWPQPWRNGGEIFYSTIHGKPLIISKGEEREMTIRLESNPRTNQFQDNKEIKIRIRFSSWDNVEIL